MKGAKGPAKKEGLLDKKGKRKDISGSRARIVCPDQRKGDSSGTRSAREGRPENLIR